MTYHCELINQPARTTLSIRLRSAVKDLPEVLPRAYRTIGDYLDAVGERPGGPPYAAYFNMDMNDLDIEAGVTIAGELPGEGPIRPGAIPSGRAAACVHVGPYDDLPKAYEALGQWIAQEGLEPAGVAYEIYVDDPMEVPPETLKTQIVMPLKAN